MAGRTIFVRLDQDNAVGGLGDGASAAKKLASGGMGAGMGGGMYGGAGMGGNDGSLYGMLGCGLGPSMWSLGCAGAQGWFEIKCSAAYVKRPLAGRGRRTHGCC